MGVRKVVQVLAACGVSLMLLTAVASAVPAEMSSTSATDRAPDGLPLVGVSMGSMSNLVATSATWRHTLRPLMPAAEPGALVMFGVALIGAARIARRRTPADQAEGAAAS